MANHVAYYEPTPEEIARLKIEIRQDWWKSETSHAHEGVNKSGGKPMFRGPSIRECKVGTTD